MSSIIKVPRIIIDDKSGNITNKLRLKNEKIKFEQQIQIEYKILLDELNTNIQTIESLNLSKILKFISFKKYQEALDIMCHIRKKYLISNLEEEIIMILDNLYKSISNKIFDNEKIYFEKILEEIKDKKKTCKNITEANNYVEITKLKINRLIDKLDLAYQYIESLKLNGFIINEISYDENTNNLIIYSENTGKFLDCMITDEKIEYKMENYEGDACLSDVEKILETANNLYNLNLEVGEYEGLPNYQHIETVNKNLYEEK
ncbi:hypothetical protein [Streptobacillus canis]|uniref:hypothetical protein n=1 Tax=Streptobacillus canis TaxID=2678686 RepID=UPI0012E2F7E2|nr:hypothetical protein [Streptobacillus canis]